MFSVLSTSTSCWTNSQFVIDLRRHDVHATSLYIRDDVIYGAWYSVPRGEIYVNSLTLERWSRNLKIVIFKLISRIDILSTQVNALGWMPQYITGDWSTLLQVLACAVKQQTITWTKVDQVLRRNMASLWHSNNMNGSNPIVWSTSVQSRRRITLYCIQQRQQR